MNLGVPRLLAHALIRALTISGLLAAAAGVTSAAENADAENLKEQADRWFELEKRIADERNEWRAQKEVLTTSIEVLEKERAALQAKVEANDLAMGLFTKRVDSARAELASQEAAHETVAAGCAAIEQQLRTLFVRLPEPLQQKIQPLLDKLERTTADTPLNISERTQTVVSALTAIDLFNNGLTLTHHLRQNGDGETLDVKVLYWGLAGAYGIDAQGAHAWILTPAASGWTWQDAPQHVLAIKTLVDVYEKQVTPTLVTLPAAGEGGAL